MCLGVLQANMRQQITRKLCSVGTLGAAIGLLARMDHVVTAEVGFVYKLFSTDYAGVLHPGRLWGKIVRHLVEGEDIRGDSSPEIGGSKRLSGMTMWKLRRVVWNPGMVTPGSPACTVPTARFHSLKEFLQMEIVQLYKLRFLKGK